MTAIGLHALRTFAQRNRAMSSERVFTSSANDIRFGAVKPSFTEPYAPFTVFSVTDFRHDYLEVLPEHNTSEEQVAVVAAEVAAIARAKRCRPDSLTVATALGSQLKYPRISDIYRLLTCLEILKAKQGPEHVAVGEYHLKIGQLYHENPFPVVLFPDGKDYGLSDKQQKQSDEETFKRMDIARQHFEKALGIFEKNPVQYAAEIADIYDKVSSNAVYKLLGRDYSGDLIETARSRAKDKLAFDREAVKTEQNIKKAYQYYTTLKALDDRTIPQLLTRLGYLYLAMGRKDEATLIFSEQSLKHTCEQMTQLEEQLRESQNRYAVAQAHKSNAELKLNKTLADLMKPSEQQGL